jgi:hypothetical protein
MTDYRLYRRDPAGRILTAPDVIYADSDQHVMRLVREEKVVSCEIWHEGRLVAIMGAS